MSMSIKSFGVFQKQITNALAMIDRKVTYLYKNINSDDQKFGFHNDDPQFTVDVTGTINTSVDYYRKGHLLMPAGTLIQFAGVTVPNGWLLCNGATLLIQDYLDLYNMIGTTYGGNGTTNFILPNFSGRVPVGSGGGYNVGAIGGEATHTLLASEMPSHRHTGTVDAGGIHNHTASSSIEGSHTHTTNSTSTTGMIPVNGSGTGTAFDSTSGEPNIYNTPIQLEINAAGSHNHTITVNNSTSHTHTFTSDYTGGGNPHNNMQPYIVIQYLIKY